MRPAIGLVFAGVALASTVAGAAAPPNPLTIDQAGTRRGFAEIATGQVTVLHFMYPTCLSFCPLSGDMLSKAQALLSRQSPRAPYRIVSVSIVPSEATPLRLTGWLRQHNARPGWVALHVPQRDLASLMRFYGETSLDVVLHSSQVLVLDREGRIVRRFADLPTAEEVARAVRQAAR